VAMPLTLFSWFHMVSWTDQLKKQPTDQAVRTGRSFFPAGFAKYFNV